MKSIRQTRLFQTERGFQGMLYHKLHEELDTFGIFDEDLLLEIEYQKSKRHKLTQRPDIILHIPAELREWSVKKGNFAVWALKKKASQAKAVEDFDKLDEMFKDLSYHLGFFINLNSEKHHLEIYTGDYKERIHSFAIRLINGEILMTHASWIKNEIHEEYLCE